MNPLIFDSNVHRENLEKAGDDSFIVTALAGPRKAGGWPSGNPNHGTV